MKDSHDIDLAEYQAEVDAQYSEARKEERRVMAREQNQAINMELIQVLAGKKPQTLHSALGYFSDSNSFDEEMLLGLATGDLRAIGRAQKLALRAIKEVIFWEELRLQSNPFLDLDELIEEAKSHE